MNKETAIQKMNTDIASPKTIEEVNQLGKVFRASGFFPEIKNEAQAVVKILAGQELNMPPMKAMQNIFVIPSKQGASIQLSGHIIASSIKQSHKYNYKLKGLDDKKCVIEFFENGKSQGDFTYTIEDARKAKLTDKYIWKTNTKDMLFNRCISAGYKKFCPDVIGLPVYTDGEIEDADVVSSQQPADSDQKETSANKPQVVNADEILNSGQQSMKKGSGNRDQGLGQNEEARNTPHSPLAELENTPHSPLEKRGGYSDNSPSIKRGQGGVSDDTQSPAPSPQKDRPYSVSTLLERYGQIAKTNMNPAGPDEILEASKALNAGCEHNTPKKEQIIRFFTGKKKLEDLTIGDCKFFTKWIPCESGEGGFLKPKDDAVYDEINNVIATVETGEIDDDDFADDIFGEGEDK